MDDQRPSVAQVVNNLEVVDVMVHRVAQLDRNTNTSTSQSVELITDLLSYEENS